MTEEYGIPANTLDPSISWKDVYWLQSITRLPIIIKGILTKEDAELAVEHGVQGIIVSNHGGRQLDGGPASVPTRSFRVMDELDVLLFFPAAHAAMLRLTD